MNVLHIASWYPSKVQPFNGDFIQRQLKALSLHMPVYVIAAVKDDEASPDEESWAENKLSDQFYERVCCYGSVKTGVGLIDRYFSSIRYKRILHKMVQDYIWEHGKPDLIHVHVAMNGGLIALQLKEQLGIPFVVTEHSTIYHPAAADRLESRFFMWRKKLKQVLRSAALLLPVSDDLGKAIQHHVPGVSCKVIPNVVDTDQFHLKTKPVSSVCELVHVSGMNYQKNTVGLLNALEQLKKIRTDWHCTMIGPASEALKDLSRKKGLADRIHWAGEVSYAEVAAYMQKSHALVLFSRYENQPCVILEALCCGLPVVTTRVGGIAEVIDASNGLFATSEQVNTLVEALDQLMKNYATFDVAQISNHATAAYNYSVVGKKIKQTYEDLLASKKISQ